MKAWSEMLEHRGFVYKMLKNKEYFKKIKSEESNKRKNGDNAVIHMQMKPVARVNFNDFIYVGHRIDSHK